MDVNGISPKVAKPTIHTIGVGVVLLIAGFALKDNTLLTMGITALGIAPGAFHLGYKADIGDVAVTLGRHIASDDLLGPEATSKIEHLAKNAEAGIS
jgi:hypothetical protein